MNGTNKSNIKHITDKINEFVNERDWKQFRNHKDMAISVAVEAAELLEHFQWKNGKDLIEHIEKNKTEIGEEMADIAIYLFEMADNMGIDLIGAMEKKIIKNGIKYPVEKVKGKNKKYRELKQ